jgi:GntR family transcriptional regulator
METMDGERTTAVKQATLHVIDLPLQPLDKNSFISLADQMQVQLLGMIRSGRLAVGDLLPGEEELGRIYGVSRVAGRKALEQVESLGYAVRQKARGTFVSRPKMERHLGRTTGFTEEMERLGLAATARVLAAHKTTALPDVARQLEIFRGTPVFHLRRLRMAGGEPMVIEESFFELERFPGIAKIDFSDLSLSRTLEERYHVRAAKIDESVEAVAAGRREARLLGVTPRTSLLAVARTARDADGKAYEAVRALYRGDRIRIVFTAPEPVAAAT